MRKLTILTLFLLACLAFSTERVNVNPEVTPEQDEIKNIESLFDDDKANFDISQETNTVTLLAKSMIFLYEKIIHPQKLHHEQFSPTCLNYSKKAYNLYNPVKATFLSSDRLLRRHPLAYLNYDKNNNGEYIDNLPLLYEKAELKRKLKRIQNKEISKMQSTVKTKENKAPTENSPK